MKRLSFACLILGLVSISILRAQPATAPAAGRVTLFNGKDISGWRIFLEDKAADASKVWSVADGVLKCDTKIRGYIVTEKTYSDYHLHVEWRWPKEVTRGNSGVLIHLHGPDTIWPLCFECQLQAGNAGQIVGTGLDIPAAPLVSNRKRAPRMAPPSEKPPGEWNTYEIHAHADTIEVFVNEVKQNRVEKLPATSGAIGLQLEGFPVEFRNVWLEPE